MNKGIYHVFAFGVRGHGYPNIRLCVKIERTFLVVRFQPF